MWGIQPTKIGKINRGKSPGKSLFPKTFYILGAAVGAIHGYTVYLW